MDKSRINQKETWQQIHFSDNNYTKNGAILFDYGRSSSVPDIRYCMINCRLSSSAYFYCKIDHHWTNFPFESMGSSSSNQVWGFEYCWIVCVCVCVCTACICTFKISHLKIFFNQFLSIQYCLLANKLEAVIS